MARVVLALGANLGDRAATLRRTVAAVAEAAQVVAVSAIYETAPVGGPPQDDYYNAVVIAQTPLSPREVLAVAHRIEADSGRTRQVRWGPRTLDIDVIAYDDVVSDDADLTLPHPRAHERAFVLVPWLDADPAAVLPGRGPVRRLLDTVDVTGVRRLVAPASTVPGDREGGE